MGKRIQNIRKRQLCRQRQPKTRRKKNKRTRKRKSRVENGNRNPKKNEKILPKTTKQKISHALKNLQNYPVKTITKALKISKRAYQYNKKQNITDNENNIEKAVITCYEISKGDFGRPRIKRELSKQGIEISDGKLYKIMKENGLIGKAGRKRKRKRNKQKKEKEEKIQQIQENLLKRKDLKNLKKHEVLVSDITEIKILNSKIYLTAVMDLASRTILGYHISTNQTQDIVHKAINMALSKIEKPEGIMFHSDRGCQYTSNQTRELLEKKYMIISKSRAGKPNDNQMIESFWNTLKTEIDPLKNLGRQEATKTIIEYINYYNSKRMHSSLNYETPQTIYEEMEEFERITKI